MAGDYWRTEWRVTVAVLHSRGLSWVCDGYRRLEQGRLASVRELWTGLERRVIARSCQPRDLGGSVSKTDVGGEMGRFLVD